MIFESPQFAYSWGSNATGERGLCHEPEPAGGNTRLISEGPGELEVPLSQKLFPPRVIGRPNVGSPLRLSWRGSLTPAEQIQLQWVSSRSVE